MVQGQVQVNSAAGLMQILQSSPQAIVNWSSFNIRPDEIVRILQPNQLSVILNRVTGLDPSVLEGMLQANGRVFLINPNGILIQSGARIDVGSFMASTLNMSDQDFLSGSYRLRQQEDRPLAALVNHGEIKVADGGFVVLTSPLLHNGGMILAQSGQVQLGATRQATFSVDGQGLMQFSVPDGFRNDLQATTPGGTVLLQPGQMTDLLAQVIAHPSIQEAPELPPEGLLVQSGRIDVGPGAIRLDSSRATVTTPASLLAANSDQSSRSGDIRVLSAGLTLSTGRVEATGTGSARGGFVEVSGSRIGLHGPVNVTAQSGEHGHFLIDPVNLTVVDAPPGEPGDAFLPDLNVGDGATDETVSTAAIRNTLGNVVLEASNNITYLQTTNTGLNTTANLTISAGNNVQIRGNSTVFSSSPVNITANSLNVTAGNIELSSFNQEVSVTTTGGDLRLNASNTVNVSGGTPNLSSAGNLIMTGQNVLIDGDAPQLSGSRIDLNGASNLRIEAQAGPSPNLSATGPVSLQGGNVTLTNRFQSPFQINSGGTATVNASQNVLVNLGTFSGSAASVLVTAGPRLNLTSDQDMAINASGVVVSGGTLNMGVGGDLNLNPTPVGGTNVTLSGADANVTVGGNLSITSPQEIRVTGAASLQFFVGGNATLAAPTAVRLSSNQQVNMSGPSYQVNSPLYVVNSSSGQIFAPANVSVNGTANLNAGTNLRVGGLNATNANLSGSNITLSSFQNVTGGNYTITTAGTLNDQATTANGSSAPILNSLTIQAGNILGTGAFDGFAVPNVTSAPAQVTVTGGNRTVAPILAGSLLQLGGANVSLSTVPGQTGDVYIDGVLQGGAPPPPPPSPSPSPAPAPVAATVTPSAARNDTLRLTAVQLAELRNQLAQSNPFLGNRTGMSEVLSEVERERIVAISPTLDVLSPTLSVAFTRTMEPMLPADLRWFEGMNAAINDETRDKKNAAYATMVDQEIREIWEVRYWRRLLEGMVLWEESQ